MPHAIASSSIADSSANHPCASPGARMMVGGGMSSRAMRCVVRRFGQAYIIRVSLAARSSVRSLIVDTCSTTSCSTAVNRPSPPAARHTRWIVGVR
jgi:hypothetical protein